MKKVLGWIRMNLISVIAIAVAVIGAPVMLYFGASWSASNRAQVAQQVSKDVQSLDSLEVQVQIDPVSPGDQPVSVRTLPNDATIEAVSAILDARHTDAATVVRRATEANRRGRGLLIDGPTPEAKLFPAPKDDSSRIRLLRQLIELWPRAHADLLSRANAGMPPTPEQMMSDLEDVRAREMKRRLSGREEQKLTPEEEAEITRLLGDRRLDFARQRARQLTVYADPSVFKAVQPWTSVNEPTIEQAWEWQWLYWVHEDVIAAVVAANTEPGRGWLPVYDAPVKRVESITVEPLFETPGGGGGGGGIPGGGREMGGGFEGGGGAAATPADPSAPIKPDYAHSPTGRAGWPRAANGVYDVRYANLTVLVAADRLPALLNAISRTNLMTVVGLKVTAVPARADLAQGFDYGGDYLVRAEIRIETIWLRGWTAPLMPKKVRDMLGIPDAAPASASAEAQPA